MAASGKPGPPPAQRWFQRKLSDFAWEQDGLDFIKRLMPNAEPYRAWATFSFTAASGRINECDLLIVVPGGLYLVELKAHPGRLINHGSTWRFKDPHSGKIRTIDNPLELTDLKAKELKGQLTRAAAKLNIQTRIPWVEPVIFLTDPGLRSELDEFQQPKVFARHPSSGLPTIWDDLLAKPPHRDAHRITPEFSAKHLPRLLKTIGIHPATAHLRYGDEWKLSPRPLDAGAFWEDRLATRDDGHLQEEGRVRIYLVSEGTSKADIEKANRAALREYQVLQGISHRGIVQAVQFREHQGRPAILFRHSESDLRLDAYLSTFGPSLSDATRLDMVRQLAEAVRYAHDRSLYHRALSPRSVYVSCREDGSRPVLRLIDWQTAARDFDTTTLRSIGDSSLDGAFIEDTAQCYLAPETDQSYPDPVDLDVFGLGAVSYLILTGQPPASKRSELKDRLSTDGGLLLSAVDDGAAPELDELILHATQADVANRLGSADAFIQELDRAEEDSAPPATPSAVAVDPLIAGAGQEIGDEWSVRKVLGTGATARALLVERILEGDDGEIVVEERVFKVALDQDKAERLHEEAKALRKVGGGFVVQLLGGPRDICGHTTLELEFAGEQSLARRLQERGRLTYHELERFGGDLFTALDQLAADGVRHRDIKPDNFGIYKRADRKYQLKLFDFSLTDAPDKDTGAGTRGYLDPFIGTLRRPAFDDYAEHYAAAVTLYEMAAGERPKWGDDLTAPEMSDDETPRIESDLFEPALRDGLTAFFERALHRDTGRRFDTLRQMADAWRSIFTAADATSPATTPATANGATDEVTDVEQARDLAAENAQLTTPLDAAGLSPRAVSVANGYGATQVGELLTVPLYMIARARGAGALTRKELNRRHKQWTARLLKATAEDREQEPAASDPAVPVDAARQSIDVLAERLQPAPARKNSRRPEVERLALGLPAPDGKPGLGPWPTQSAIAAHLRLSQPSVSRHFVDAIKVWKSLDWLAAVRRELVGIVADLGRIATAQEVAAEFRARHGASGGDDALAKSLAVVRAAVEAELSPQDDADGEPVEPELAVLRRHNTVLIACESLTGTDVPSPNELGDYAVDLGKAADRLAATDPLPGSATVLRDLRAVPTPEGMRPLADTRLVALAAALADIAEASRRLELYPRDLGLVRALRISQAAAGTQAGGITLANLLARVRARFPDLDLGEPTYVEVEEALAEAGSRLTYDPAVGRFKPPQPSGRRASSRTTSSSVTSIDSVAIGTGRTSTDLLATQLTEAMRLGGFLALTVRGKHLPGTVRAVTEAYGVLPVDVGRRFLTEFRALAQEKNQSWERVLAADARVEPGGAVPKGLAAYCRAAWERVRAQLSTEAGPGEVLFLHNAGLIGRYYEAGGHAFLTGLQKAARDPEESPHGMWLLCPAEAPRDTPRLAGRLVETLVEPERAVLKAEFLESLRQSDVA